MKYNDPNYATYDAHTGQLFTTYPEAAAAARDAQKKFGWGQIIITKRNLAGDIVASFPVNPEN